MIDPPWPGLDEMLAEHLAAEEHAFEIDADDPIELVFGDVEKRGGRVDAGAVDDDVDAAGALKHGGEQRFDLSFARRFGRVKPCAAAGRLDRGEPRPGLLLVSADDARPRRPRPQALRPSRRTARRCRR